MAGWLRGSAVLVALFVVFWGPESALAQKSGGVLRIYHRDSPASM